MRQSINQGLPLAVRNEFFERCAGKMTFLLVSRRAGGSFIGIYAGHSENEVTLRDAGDENRRTISFAEALEVEII